MWSQMGIILLVVVVWSKEKFLFPIYYGYGEKQSYESGIKDCYPELVRQATIINYKTNCFKIPSSILNEIDGLQRKFWWGFGSSGRSRMCSHKWSHIFAPICGGGLGIRPLSHLNATFLTKPAWRMVSTPLHLLSRMFLTKYYWKGRLVEWWLD